MKTVVQIVNLIRGGNKAHRHRHFITFLEELNAELNDQPQYTKVRWLSTGKTLQYFFGFRKDILSFLLTALRSLPLLVCLQIFGYFNLLQFIYILHYSTYKKCLRLNLFKLFLQTKHRENANDEVRKF